MAAFLDVLLVLVFIVIPATGLCLQAIPQRLSNVTFHDTDSAHAWVIVRQYAEGTFEQRFGYPTGYFYADEKRSERPTRVLMREAQPAGAITDGCSLQISALSMSGFDAGCLPGCMLFFATVTVGAPFLLVSFFDRFFRLLLRSRVDVHLRADGPDTIADFAFYGPGGYALRRRYGQVFEAPELPAGLGLATATPAAAPAVGRHRA
ncbi:MAG: hypothetical protein ACRDOK_05360 [Streptosporangiaceae bacterium]